MAFVLAAWVLWAGCYSPDPRSPKGAIAYAMEALGDDDGERLFLVIDERSRHALHSVFHDRKKAAALIEASYPEELRAQALRRLGESARVSSPAALFATRCSGTCRQDLISRLGAPLSQKVDKGIVEVTTARGTLQLRKGSDTWYGLVWRTDALNRERARANADLARVKANAELYERQRKLR